MNVFIYIKNKVYFVIKAHNITKVMYCKIYSNNKNIFIIILIIFVILFSFIDTVCKKGTKVTISIF